MNRSPRSVRPLAAAVALAAATACAAAQAAGLDIRPGADPARIGLPVYPGASPRPAQGDDQGSFSLGVWGGAFGLQVATLSYRSGDGVDAVAAFYRDALAKFGPVADCSAGAPRAPARPRSDEPPDAPDSCADEHPAPGARVLKVGHRGDHRLVEIKPLAHGAEFQLVRLQTRGD